MMKGRLAVSFAVVLALTCVAARAVDPALSPGANGKYLADHAQQKGVISRPDGLQYRIVQNGSGKHPSLNDRVEVYYTGSLINGTVFDGTEDGFPRVMEVQNLIPGWKEALQIMREGDHWELVIPAGLAYGTRGSPDGSIPPSQTLKFDLHLIKVQEKTPEELAHEQAEKAAEEDSHPGPGAE